MNLTAKDIAEIEAMAGLGLPLEDIARIKNLNVDLLEEKGGDAIQRGRAKGRAKVMAAAFRMAASGKLPAMTLSWLKAQANWRENPAKTILPQEQTELLLQIQASKTPTLLLTKYLAKIIEQIAKGELDPTVASSIAAMSNTLMKASQQGNVEERLVQLEALIKSQEPQPLDLDL